MACDLCRGPPPPLRARGKAGRRPQLNERKFHEAGSHGNGSDDKGEDKEHKGKTTIHKRRKGKPSKHWINGANAGR